MNSSSDFGDSTLLFPEQVSCHESGMLNGVRRQANILAWRAWRNGGSYELATQRAASAIFQQETGRWDTTAVPPQVPLGPPLALPQSLNIP